MICGSDVLLKRRYRAKRQEATQYTGPWTKGVRNEADIRRIGGRIHLSGSDKRLDRTTRWYLTEQVASLSAQVAELQSQVSNLTTQLNKEVAARKAAAIQIDPRMGMAFNELYVQVVQAGCGWLQLESKNSELSVYHVVLSKAGCDQKILYSFKDDQLVKIE